MRLGALYTQTIPCCPVLDLCSHSLWGLLNVLSLPPPLTPPHKLWLYWSPSLIMIETVCIHTNIHTLEAHKNKSNFFPYRRVISHSVLSNDTVLEDLCNARNFSILTLQMVWGIRNFKKDKFTLHSKRRGLLGQKKKKRKSQRFVFLEDWLRKNVIDLFLYLAQYFSFPVFPYVNSSLMFPHPQHCHRYSSFPLVTLFFWFLLLLLL